MDSAQWTQEFGVARAITMERKGRPQKEEAVNCPRCHSTNTKFCYYNNYSLTQPRYFCKTCRRYWTEGGTLRNVPVGGGSRKNKRYAATPQKHHLPDLNPPPLLTINSQNPKLIQDIQGHDLNLGFQDYHNHNHNHNHNHGQFLESRDHNVMHASSSTSSALNFLRGFNSFMPMGDQTSNVNNIYAASAGFPCKPFLVDDVVSNGYGNPNLDSSSSLMTFALGSAAANIKRNTITTTTHEGGDDIDQDKAAAAAGQQNSNGLIWINGMLGGTSAPNW